MDPSRPSAFFFLRQIGSYASGSCGVAGSALINVEFHWHGLI